MILVPGPPGQAGWWGYAAHAGRALTPGPPWAPRGEELIKHPEYPSLRAPEPRAELLRQQAPQEGGLQHKDPRPGAQVTSAVQVGTGVTRAHPLPLHQHDPRRGCPYLPRSILQPHHQLLCSVPVIGIQPRVLLLRRVILSLGTQAMSGESGRGACKLPAERRRWQGGWLPPSKSGCGSGACRDTAAPRQSPEFARVG